MLSSMWSRRRRAQGDPPLDAARCSGAFALPMLGAGALRVSRAIYHDVIDEDDLGSRRRVRYFQRRLGVPSVACELARQRSPGSSPDSEGRTGTQLQRLRSDLYGDTVVVTCANVDRELVALPGPRGQLLFEGPVPRVRAEACEIDKERPLRGNITITGGPS